MLKATSRGQTLNPSAARSRTSRPVTVTPPGKEETVTLDKAAPGLWRKPITAGEQGVYRISPASLRRSHRRQRQRQEVSAVTATDAALSPILNGPAAALRLGATRPTRCHYRASSRCAAVIIAPIGWACTCDAYHVQGVRLFPLFTGFLALVLLPGLMAITWFREGH
jgi:hypothetical protein